MNKKIFKILLSFIISLFLIYILNNSFFNKPPLGKILDPFHGIWQNSHKNIIEIPKTLIKNKLVKDNIKISFDSNLIPHIDAKNDYDMYFAIGYISAFHRLWKMDFTTRATEGRLSEIFGYNTKLIEYDKLQRKKALKLAAKKALKIVMANQESAECLNAFTNGVNTYIKSLKYKKLPIEFKLLNYNPELWSPYKTMLVIAAMVDKLSGKDTAIEHTNALKIFGRKKFDFLYPNYTDDVEPIIHSKNWNFKPITVKTPNYTPPTYIPKISTTSNSKNKRGGSNNWALSGKKTISGYPYLANDPHLDISLPSLFYLIHAKSDNQNIIGAIAPGTPFVTLGFNKFTAFGLTNSLMNSRDWYLIKFEDDTFKEYKYEGKNFKTQIITEEIKIKGHKSIYIKILNTHIGPTFYSENQANDKNEVYGLALKWSGYNIGNVILAGIKMNKAKNHTEFKEALDLLNLNVNYASAFNNGDIAMHVAGKYVARWKEQGRFLMDGNSSEYEWQKYIPKSHNPQILNPRIGYVSSANEHPTYKSYPYFHHGYWYRHYRNKRINQILNSKKKFSINDMKKMQLDTYDSSAAELLTSILPFIKVSDLNKKEKKIFSIIESWDYKNDPNKVAPSIYREWFNNIYSSLWKNILNLDLKIKPPSNHTTIFIIKNYPNSKYLDYGEYNSMQELINSAFKTTISNLDKWERENKKPYIWSNYNCVSLNHVIPNFKSFGVKNIAIGGSKFSLNCNEPKNGVSIRFIAELGKENKGYFIYPGGQTGDIGNPYYTSFVEKWRKGEYITLNISDKEIQYPYILNFIPKN
ncbi:MAG: penicillin acylase family protein [Bacteroidetes bacterium]|nr:penicillin acylase family protein [Bacteroidota bacterium]